MESSPTENIEKYAFPKKIGIVFLERRRRMAAYKSTGHKSTSKQKDELSLDFDQDACAFFLVQMNQHQKVFEFQIVDIPTKEGEEYVLPRENDKKDLFGWLDRFALDHSSLGINYWMGITNEQVPGGPTRHFEGMRATVTKSRKMLWIITSGDWERKWAPPSLFEYLLATVFRCTLESLSRELGDRKIEQVQFLRHKLHVVTRGCIFDFTHRRSSVSIFKLCFGCKQKLFLLEKLIIEKGNYVNLVDDVNAILSKKWMGTLEKRGSPLYDLKKIYKYDVDHNSGYYKTWKDKYRESIIDKLAEWTVGNLVGGIIGGLIVVIFVVIFGIKP